MFRLKWAEVSSSDVASNEYAWGEHSEYTRVSPEKARGRARGICSPSGAESAHRKRTRARVFASCAATRRERERVAQEAGRESSIFIYSTGTRTRLSRVWLIVEARGESGGRVYLWAGRGRTAGRTWGQRRSRAARRTWSSRGTSRPPWAPAGSCAAATGPLRSHAHPPVRRIEFAASESESATKFRIADQTPHSRLSCLSVCVSHFDSRRWLGFVKN